MKGDMFLINGCWMLILGYGVSYQSNMVGMSMMFGGLTIMLMGTLIREIKLKWITGKKTIGKLKI